MIGKHQWQAEIGGSVPGWRFDWLLDAWIRDDNGAYLEVRRIEAGNWRWCVWDDGAHYQGSECCAWEGMRAAKKTIKFIRSAI